MNLENSSNKLKEIIGDRVVGFICFGQSLAELKKRIQEFKDKNICWISLNNYKVAETILNEINEKLSVVLCYASGYLDIKFDGYLHRYSEGRGNSLFEFINQCVENDIKKVILFGADGYSKTSFPYYGVNLENSNQILAHKRDVDKFNEDIKSLDFKNSDIVNCSIDSFYEGIKKITYDEALLKLKDVIKEPVKIKLNENIRSRSSSNKK